MLSIKCDNITANPIESAATNISILKCFEYLYDKICNFELFKN